jgi:hypothetical protein
VNLSYKFFVPIALFFTLAAIVAPPVTADDTASQAEIAPAVPGTKNSVSVMAGPALVSYRLRGVGFNSTLPFTAGTGFGFHGSREIAPDWKLWSKFSKFGTEFTALVGLTPTIASLNQYDFSFGTSYDPKFTGWAQGIRLQLGYGVQWTRGTLTTPNAVFASNDAMGPILGISYENQLPSWKVRSQFQVWFPNWFRETGVKTGSLEYSVRFNWQIEAGYSFTPSVSVFISPAVVLEKQGFGGTGTRGVTEAGQTLLSILLPLSVEVHF